MTIDEAITHVDKLKPNQYAREFKIKWLSKLDGLIYREIFLTHDGNTLESFEGYNGDTPVDTQLLVPYPYDEDIYNYYLQAQIDKENCETARYNQTITLYNNAYMTFWNWYNQTHTPVPRCQRFKF